MNKKLFLLAIPLLAVGMVIAASVYYASLHVTATVNEPVQVSSDESKWYTVNTQGLDFGTQATSTYPGQSVTLATIYLNNLATVNENVYMNLSGDHTDWTITANEDYNIDGSATSITPGEHEVVLTATYTGDTSGTVFDGTLTIGGTLQE